MVSESKQESKPEPQTKGEERANDMREYAAIRSAIELIQSYAGSRPSQQHVLASSFRQTPEIDKLAKALAAAQKKIRPAARNSTNPHFKHKYADLSAVIEAVIPHLADQGIAVIQGANMERTIREVSVYEPPRFGKLTSEQANTLGTMIGLEMAPKTDEIEETTVSVTTRLLHESGQWMENECSAVARGSDPQAVGSVITYLKRYGLAAMTACAADEDDDGERAYGRGRSGGDGSGKKGGGSAAGKRSAKLAKKDVDAIVTAFDKFKIPLAKLEEKLGKKAGAWTDDDRATCTQMYKDIEEGTSAEDIFGADIQEPQEAKDEPGSDG